MSVAPINAPETSAPQTGAPETASDAGNCRILMVLALVVTGMVGLAYASVPLYQPFCQVTGYGGTTQVSDSAAEQIVYGHPVRVRFDAEYQSGAESLEV